MTTPDRTHGRLLVVDDEVNARTALASLLSDEGYDVETARDGSDALEKLASFAPDVLVTDVRMPHMDGLELLRRARAQDPHLGVIVMTAFANVKDAVLAMREGALHYVTKPVDTDEQSLHVARAI